MNLRACSSLSALLMFTAACDGAIGAGGDDGATTSGAGASGAGAGSGNGASAAGGDGAGAGSGAVGGNGTGAGGGATGGNGGGSEGTGGAASTGGGGPLCTTLGWCELLDTKIDDVCPNRECWGVVGAWSGAVADTLRNRLVVWGGGHQDYYGNEVYALDLTDVKMWRLNEPSPPNQGDCVETLSDGEPNSRHTYNGLAYIAHADAMFAFGGSLACNGGYFSDGTWSLDFGSMNWTLEKSSGPATAVPGASSDYDAGREKVYLQDLDELWQYDFDTNTYALLESNNGEETDYHQTGVFDPVRDLWIMIGGGQVRVHTIGNGTAGPMQIWDNQTSGCDGIQDADYPGLAFYPPEGVIVGWAGGDDIIRFDPDTKTCSTVTYTGGPGNQQMYGTHGRFRYFPDLGVFALVNDTSQNAYTLRLD